MPSYNVRDWYWFVGDDRSHVFASGRGAFVPVSDPAYQAHVAAGNLTNFFPGQDELLDVMTRYGVVFHPSQYRHGRASAYIAELSKGEGAPSFQDTIGDVLDVLITQVAGLTAVTGNSPTPEFAALTSKISAIKARFPKS
jgi:hypothetical protein